MYSTLTRAGTRPEVLFIESDTLFSPYPQLREADYPPQQQWLCDCRPSEVSQIAPRAPSTARVLAPIRCRLAIRRLPVRVISVGKSRSAGTQLLVKDYAEKISRYCPFEDLPVRSNPKGTSDVRVQVEAEGDRVLKALHPADWVVVLDERGRTVTSEQLAQLIADCADASHRSLTFVVGGPYGHGSQVTARANSSIRLSSLVLNHEVALVVLAEQLYRAWTILKGEKYHH
ncbi:unnamed protein product [Closterium sp. Yama58-4]|nr:unnamed protein product [Closterium sp. Yama58-4]